MAYLLSHNNFTKRLRGCGKCKEKICDIIVVLVNELRMTTNVVWEANGTYEIRKLLVPSMLGMFESIKWLVQSSYIIWMRVVTKSHGCCIKTFSFKFMCKNAFLISTWWIGHDVEMARLKIMWIVIGLTIGLNVLWQSMSICYDRPSPTSLVL